MFVRTKTLKSGNQTQQYYQLVETIKERNIPRKRVIYTLGKVEDYDQKKVDDIICALEEYAGEVRILKSLQDFTHIWSKSDGDIFALEEMWEELDLDNFFFPMIQDDTKYSYTTIIALKVLIFHELLTRNRIPIENWLRDSVHFPSSEELGSDDLSKAYGFFAEKKERIQEGLSSLFSTYINTFDTRVIYGGLFNLEFPSTNRAFSRDTISFPVFMVLDREGLPLEYHLLPYGTDLSHHFFLEQVERLKEKYSPEDLIFIDDEGLLSSDQYQEITSSGCDFITLLPRHIWRKIGRDAETYRGRFSRVHADLHIKEFTQDDRRYVQCSIPSQKAYEKEMRNSFLKDLSQELSDLDALRRKTYELQEDPVKGLFIRQIQDGLKLNKATVMYEERFEGSIILHMSNTNLKPEEMALTWRHFLIIKDLFHSLHQYPTLEPGFTYAQERVLAHLSHMIMSYSLERFFAKKLSLAGLRIDTDEAFRRLKWMKVSRIRFSDKEFLVRVDSNEEVKEVLEALHYRQPFRIEEVEEEEGEDFFDDLWEEGEEVEGVEEQ